jgi:hypothetical protein
MHAALLALSLLGCRPGGPDTGDPGSTVTAGDALAPRRVRLLNVAEYRASVRALLPQLDSGRCADTPDCNLTAQSCADQVCAADACAVHTFVLPSPSGPLGSEVVVAGAFNGWGATAAAGGYRMTWVPAQSLYYAKAELGDGTWLYKFVVDGGRWMEDPANPQTTPDGFGGNNSVLVQTCAGAPAPEGGFDPAAGFLPDTRPEGFPFDTHADAGLVNASRAEQYLEAGARVAERVLRDPDALLGCAHTDDACVSGWLGRFASAAFRRTATPTELDRLLGQVQGGDTRVEGLSAALQTVLSHPEFLYRFEVGAPSGDGYLLSGWETAGALSYFLWGAPPDEALLGSAASLATAAGREAAARRMLADPRARSTWRRFVVQWLGIEPVLTTDKSPAMFPQVTPALRAEMMAETAAFAEEVAFSGGTLDDLLGARWTVAGPLLRALYQLPPGAGRVDLPPERAGLLGHASVLAVTSHSDQSSPIRRGLFVRQRLLCEAFPPPPAVAGGVPDVDPNATTRERFSQHSSDPSCASCHRFIDPVGFGFETFDAIGAHRTTEAGKPIDPSGDMVDVDGRGTDVPAPFSSLPELAAILAASEAAPRCLVAQVVRFALGAEVEPDDPRLDGLVARFEASGRDLQELLVAVAGSDLMVQRRAP